MLITKVVAIVTAVSVFIGLIWMLVLHFEIKAIEEYEKEQRIREKRFERYLIAEIENYVNENLSFNS